MNEYYRQNSRSRYSLYSLKDENLSASPRRVQNGQRRRRSRVDEMAKKIDIIDGRMNWDDNTTLVDSQGLPLVPNIGRGVDLLHHDKGIAETLYTLDVYPSLLGHSVRRLKSSTTNIIESRRTDSSQQDIGVVLENMDTDSLLTFVGTGDGFLPTIYDQANSYNWIQPSASLQPQNVSSGSLVTDGGIITNNFSSHKAMHTSSTVDLSGASELWLFLVLNVSNPTASQMVYETSATSVSNSGAFGVVVFSNTLIVQQNNSGARVQVSVPLSTGHQLIAIRLLGGQSDTDSCDIWINESPQIKTLVSSGTSPATYSNYVHYLGSRNDTSLFFSGSIQENILRVGDLSSDRSGLESVINNYYGIY